MLSDDLARQGADTVHLLLGYQPSTIPGHSAWRCYCLPTLSHLARYCLLRQDDAAAPVIKVRVRHPVSKPIQELLFYTRLLAPMPVLSSSHSSCFHHRPRPSPCFCSGGTCPSSSEATVEPWPQPWPPYHCPPQRPPSPEPVSAACTTYLSDPYTHAISEDHLAHCSTLARSHLLLLPPPLRPPQTRRRAYSPSSDSSAGTACPSRAGCAGC